MDCVLVNDCKFLLSILPFADNDLSEESGNSLKTRHQLSGCKQTTEDGLRCENNLLRYEAYALNDVIELQRVWYEKQINEEKMKRSRGRSCWESRGSRERENELERLKLEFESERNELSNQIDEAERALKLSFFQARNMDDKICAYTQTYRATIQKMGVRIKFLDKSLKLSVKENFELKTDVLYLLQKITRLLQKTLVPVFVFVFVFLIYLISSCFSQTSARRKNRDEIYLLKMVQLIASRFDLELRRTCNVPVILFLCA